MEIKPKNFFRKLSGLEDLFSIALVRFIIGILFIAYGVLIDILIEKTVLEELSIFIAFAGLGLMFILDGQNVLREYFKNNPRVLSKILSLPKEIKMSKGSGENFLDRTIEFILNFFGELCLILGAIIIGVYFSKEKFSILLGIIFIGFYILIKNVQNESNRKM
jgi:hypothetical protein